MRVLTKNFISDILRVIHCLSDAGRICQTGPLVLTDSLGGINIVSHDCFPIYSMPTFQIPILTKNYLGIKESSCKVYLSHLTCHLTCQTAPQSCLFKIKKKSTHPHPGEIIIF